MKKAWKILGAALSIAGILSAAPNVDAKKKNEPEKILFIPHDNRPISYKQTVDVVEKVGYKIVVPPDELLGGRENLGNPEKLWLWLEENATKDVKAAVISSDSMLYGSLVGSRKHDYQQNTLFARAELFREFRKEHKKLPLYVFGSIMRTPRNGEASGYGEPDYYRNYGANIFRYTELVDKREIEGLTNREKKELDFLMRLIPSRALSDWMGRRKKNFAANEKLIDLARANTFNYFLLGRDDNAPYSQTHLESRYLTKYGANINKKKYQALAGIDEVGLMMLTRAINERTKTVPSIFVKYNWGRGAETVPSYSDEKIDDSISAAIFATGSFRSKDPSRADFILAVNTNPNGQTFEANYPVNDAKDRDGTKFFVDTVQDYVSKGRPVVVADIAFANGSDNALMENLKNRGLLMKLQGYAGWNTATNSTGFAISEGILSKKMSRANTNDLLVTRYLDDWAYQANVRNIVASQLIWLRGDGFYGALNDKRDQVSDRCSRMMKNFAEKNLPPFKGEENLRVYFPWNRMFESDVVRN